MAETIEAEIAQITFYLAKEDTTFDSILDDDAGLDGKLAIRKADFEVDDIHNSACPTKTDYLAYIKPAIEDTHGRDYTLCLWLLFNKAEAKPGKSDIPLISQSELKLMHDHLRRICKFRDIVIRFIPVKVTRYTQLKKNKQAA